VLLYEVERPRNSPSISRRSVALAAADTAAAEAAAQISERAKTGSYANEITILRGPVRPPNNISSASCSGKHDHNADDACQMHHTTRLQLLSPRNALSNGKHVGSSDV